MTDQSRATGTDPGTDRGSPPRMPRWMKWSAVIVLALVLLFVGLKVAGVGGGMDHGPGAPSMSSH